MGKFRSELPKTTMNRLLERAAKRLKGKSLLEKIQLQVRARLLTVEEAAEIKARFSSAQLSARPEPSKKPTVLPLTSPVDLENDTMIPKATQ